MTDPVTRLHPVVVHHVVNTLGWRTLRPLQEQAIEPVLNGKDALLLAPTAGGKTEAAFLPVLSAMEDQGWTGVSVLFLCPLKALLNDLLPRLASYGSWVGRRVDLWHGDVSTSKRRKILRDPPDVLLTTPESLESMLVSPNVDHHRFLSGVRAVVIDEVHAFAGDDRGWHLLAVLERLSVLTQRPIQRIGLSATVGNPSELLAWMQGSGQGARPGIVVAPHSTARTGPPPGDIELDYVGSVDNAAAVIAALHRGEKRLVFCDSRQLVEEIGAALRARGVTTHLSHASLSLDERRRAERAFADSRDCVIVATSTLELGIDVGDLDRVVQINTPSTVASFLQRLGRSGRRAGTTRNCLFLAIREEALLWSSALLLLWGRGYVEAVQPPADPRHIIAQQTLALCLQEQAIDRATWQHAWNDLPPFDSGADAVLGYLLGEGFIEQDGPMMFIGPEAERRFGRRNFMDMTAVFTAPPQFTVLEGRREVGRADPALLTEKVEGPRLLLLAGRSWKVTWIDWKRRRCFVEPADYGGRARWLAPGTGGVSFAMARAARDVLLGADPPVVLTQRAQRLLSELRDDRDGSVHPAATVITRSHHATRWWTWAGFRANATLTASLAWVAEEKRTFDDVSIRLRGDLTRESWRTGSREALERVCLPEVDERALRGLKFADALPPHLAEATLATRMADVDAARALLGGAVRFVAR
ncbi:ATP-dependent helicase [Actinoalloteichus sp. AHMU CJ021]|uniref:DEAD/DEAH box helicase n=1 Tax=Actinoalloteichus TaxID=65496 RepID=UPI0004AA305A|nr:DEAD/DEAH box helicase [Actinoalloteichus caeruleus]AUS80420.1 ATP-dependent helicase [Actinoalloteichus sp. AHMU CJ021]